VSGARSVAGDNATIGAGSWACSGVGTGVGKLVLQPKSRVAVSKSEINRSVLVFINKSCLLKTISSQSAPHGQPGRFFL